MLACHINKICVRTINPSVKVMLILLDCSWYLNISRLISGGINSVTAEFETKINTFCIVKILEREFYLKMVS